MFEFFTDLKNALFPLSGSYTLYGDVPSIEETNNDQHTLSVVGKDGEVTPIVNEETDNDRVTVSVIGKDGEVTPIANVDAS